MSITIGFLNKNGKPAEEQIIESMKKAYNKVPYDSYKYKSDGEFALAHMNINILNDNPIEEQPVTSNSGRYLASARIRIDNRKDLINQLNLVDRTDTSKLSDTSIFLHAFEKWNTDTFDKVIGDYAIVIWDRKDKKLFIAKDMGGHYPLYYYETQETFYFASTPKAFLELSDYQKEINYKSLIEQMLPFPVNNNPNSTVYKDIFAFYKFHYYVINQNGITKEERHWKPEYLTQIKYKDENDYIEHFKELYDDAVITRISPYGQMGSYLSGGLDSSSVTVIAHDYLQKSERKIFSYSSVPQYPEKMPVRKNSISDETPYINSILDMYPNINQKFIKSEDFFPIDAMEIDLDYNGLYTSNFQNGYWHWKILQNAVSEGVNVILTGQAGNLTISRTGADLYEHLLRNLNISLLLKEVKADASLRGKSSFKILAGNIYNLLKRYLAVYFPDKFDETLNRDYLNPFINEVLENYNINEDYKKSLIAEKKIRFKGDIQNTLINMRILQMHIAKKGGNQNLDYNLQNKIEMRDPTGDRRINEYTKRIPAYIFKKNGVERHLIREAMKGRLPDKVRLNPMRGKQAKDLSYRVKLDMKRTEDALNSFSHPIIKFDMNKINNALKEIKEENITQELFAKTTKLVLHPVAIIKFINHLDKNK
jgi:asparagine synthase (glutamine-hydrolysing)